MRLVDEAATQTAMRIKLSDFARLCVHTITTKPWSIEEAAESVGATKAKTFKDIVAPLIWKGILVGALYSFILALQEASATLLLVIPGREMMTVGIFNFYIGGSVNEAAALGLVLIILGALCLWTISKLAGTRMGGVFG